MHVPNTVSARLLIGAGNDHIRPTSPPLVTFSYIPGEFFLTPLLILVGSTQHLLLNGPLDTVLP